jgi:hypothetical protein
MPRIAARGDNLNEENRKFEQTPLESPVFLNSVPKCGTHLLRNIMRMFVPLEQQYHSTFIQIPNVREHAAAFDPRAPRLSWGHLLFSDNSAIALGRARHVLLVRDPYDWVLARARFFLSDTFEGNVENLKNGRVTAEDMLNMMIFGIYQKAPALSEIFTHNAAAWLGTRVKLLRFEDLLGSVKTLDSQAAEDFFTELFDYCGMAPLPADWRQRIQIGSDRRQSGTARENLAGDTAIIPDVLPETQKRLIDFAAPGLRALLGYA